MPDVASENKPQCNFFMCDFYEHETFLWSKGEKKTNTVASHKATRKQNVRNVYAVYYILVSQNKCHIFFDKTEVD